MKKVISLILCLFLVGCVYGCKKSITYQQPVTFYYLQRDPSYDSNSKTIQAHILEGKDLKDFQETILTYLQGPEDASLYSPFPANMLLLGYETFEQTLYLTFSDELGTLSGLELTLACCCLALTAMDLTGMDQVNISADRALLDGERSIQLSRDTILLMDLIQQPHTD